MGQKGGLYIKEYRMRIVKFRIWDKQNRRFVKNDCLLHCESNLMIDPFTGQVNDFVRELGDHETYSRDNTNKYLDWETKRAENKYVLQQYTGLKDKNGKEIYECDVVKVKRCFVRPYIKDGKIDYKCSEGDLDIGQVFRGNDASFLVEYKGHDDTEEIRNIPHRYEIIGNIFENKV